MKYSEKLKDPRWQKKRLEILNRDSFTCQKCFDKVTTLNVHHQLYLPGKDPWEYEDIYLVTLCETCHEYEKEMMDSAISDLVFTLKTHGFFANNIQSLAANLLNLRAHPDPFCAYFKNFITKLNQDGKI